MPVTQDGSFITTENVIPRAGAAVGNQLVKLRTNNRHHLLFYRRQCYALSFS